MLNKLPIVMMFAYPVVAHIAIWFKFPSFIVGYLIFIFFAMALVKCLSQHWYTGAVLFAFSLFMSYLLQQQNIQLIIYLPPILILFSLFILFSHSLLKNQTPLITRYALLLSDKDKLDVRHFNYSRSVTVAWSIFFLLMTFTSVTLAVLFSLEIWSLFSNIISYVLMTSFFVIEFFVRKHHLANVSSSSVEGGFFQFIGKIIKIRPNNMKQ